jgi:hypothetical protein
MLLFSQNSPTALSQMPLKPKKNKQNVKRQLMLEQEILQEGSKCHKVENDTKL